MPSEHILSAFERELNQLNATLNRLGAAAAAQFHASIAALAQRDVDAAEVVIAGDESLDAVQHEVEAACVRMLALRQPAADDLRLVITSIKLASEFERIGDLAKNIAKRVIALAQLPAAPAVNSIPRLAQLAEAILSDALDALAARDVDLARRAWARDKELDDGYTSLFREMLTYMMEDARSITACTHLLFIAKNIERIGDHATNVAEMVSFLAVGMPLSGDRPKGDLSSGLVLPNLRG